MSPSTSFLPPSINNNSSTPGGDLIKDLLTTGAGGRPVLLLLDEVLKYMERAAAVAVLDSTLQRQAKDFCTRGALRFLASCLSSLKKNSGA